MALPASYQACRRAMLGLGGPLAAIPSGLQPGHEERLQAHERTATGWTLPDYRRRK